MRLHDKRRILRTVDEICVSIYGRENYQTRLLSDPGDEVAWEVNTSITNITK